MNLSRSKKVTLAIVVTMSLGLGGVLIFKKNIEKRLEGAIPLIEKIAAQSFGSEIHFKSIHATMNGLLPEFELLDLTVGQSGKEADSKSELSPLRVEKVAVQIDLFRSFLRFRPQVGKIEIQGAHLEVIETRERQWGVVGLPQDSSASRSSPVSQPDWMAPDFSIEVSRSSFHVSPQGTKPVDIQVGKVEGRVKVSPSDGRIRLSLSSGPLGLTAPTLWFRPQEWKKLRVEVSVDPVGREIQVNQFVVNAPDLQIEGSMGYQLTSGFINLRARMERASLNALKHVLPLSMIPSSAKVWIDTAIQEGETGGGTLLLSGYPEEWKGLNSFEGKRNRLEIDLPLEKLKLDYQENWPVLNEAQGELKLMGKALGVDLKSAQAGTLKLRNAQAKIPDLSDDEMTLALQGQVQAETPEDLIEFLKTGPFSAESESLLSLAYPIGPSYLTVEANIPLLGEGVRFSGKAEVQQTSLRVLDRLERSEWSLNLEGIQGMLSFSEKELVTEELKATLFGNPAQVSFKHRIGVRGPLETDAQVKSRMPVDQVERFLPNSTIRKVLAGEVPSELNVKVAYGSPKSSPKILLGWKSDLEGAELLAPSPLGKAKGEKLPVIASASMIHGSLEKGSLEIRGAMNVKATLSPLQENKWKVSVSGEAQHVQLDRWKEWWDGLQLNSERKPSSTEDEDEVEEESNEVSLLDVQLKGSQFGWKSLEFHDPSIQFEKKGENWSAHIRSKEAWGDLAFNPERMEAKFRYLKLPRFPWNTTSPNNPSPTPDPSEGSQAPWDLKGLPSLSLRVDQLEVQNKDLGVLRAEVKQTGKELMVQDLSVLGKEFELKLKKGVSDYSANQPFTSLEGNLVLNNAVPPFEFKSMKTMVLNQGEIHWSAKWPGGPEQFGFQKMTGRVDGHIREGKLEGVQSGIQSVFNFLSMSWADARKQVMRFSKAYFDIALENGELKTRIGRALFGSVYVKTYGIVAIPSGAIKMEAVVTPSVEDIGDDPSQEIEEAKNFLTHTYKVGGVWPNPEVGLKVF